MAQGRAFRYVRRAITAASVLATLSLWGLPHGHNTIACGPRSSEWRRVENLGVLRYYTVVESGGTGQPTEEHAIVNAWRLTASIVLTGLLLAGAWKLWRWPTTKPR